jgi:hypothetical protein
MTSTPVWAPTSGVADAGTANSDTSPRVIVARTAASATNTRPAAGRSSQPVVRLAGMIVTADSLSAVRDRHAVLRGGWQLKKKVPWPAGLVTGTRA